MDKFVGFDIDNNKTVACVVQKGRKERFATLPSKVEAMREFLQREKQQDDTVHLTFEISGEAGFLYGMDRGLAAGGPFNIAAPRSPRAIARTAVTTRTRSSYRPAKE